MRSSLRAPVRHPKGVHTLPAHTLKYAGHLLLFAGFVHAQSPSAETQGQHRHPPANRTYLGQDIFVARGQQIGDATCLFCSVQVEGELSGNVLVLFGNLTVTGRVAGNTAVVGGNTVVDSEARIGGRTTVIDGNAVYETDDALSGNAYVLGGHISSFAGHAGTHRRFSLSPAISLGIAVLAVLLLGALLFPRPHRRTRHA